MKKLISIILCLSFFGIANYALEIPVSGEYLMWPYFADNFEIIEAKIVEVTATAESKIKTGILNYQYIGKIGDEEIVITPLTDIDLDDSEYPDIKIGESYILIVRKTQSREEFHKESGLMNPVIPSTDLAKRIWSLPSYIAYNINFGKLIPYQNILKLQLPDNRPDDIKSIIKKWYEKIERDGRTPDQKDYKQKAIKKVLERYMLKVQTDAIFNVLI